MEKCKCAICGKVFERHKSHIIGKNQFCSRKHKEKGMILGLCNPSRLGTGYGVKDILTRRKYYKYRQFDDKNGYDRMVMNVREFCKIINKSKCIYCESVDNLGFDRINNKIGHLETNTVICCALCNMTRGDRFTVNEMKQIGKIIKSFRSGDD